MDIIWGEQKNEKLRRERGICFEDFVDDILDGKFLASLENPARPGQRIFVMSHEGYTYVLPYVLDDEKNIILKTAFPSRKYHKRFGGE